MALPGSPFPVDERQRLDALHRYRILDTPADPAFDRLTALAAWIFRTPIALISLIDLDRQWFKSTVGLKTQQTPRAIAFCDVAISGEHVLVVPDAEKDDRFADNPLVTGDPHIRFYAGAPIRTPDGFALGTLSIIDRVPRTFDADDAERLRVLAALAGDAMELHLALFRTRDAQTQALESLAMFKVLAEAAAAGVYMIQHGRFRFVNRAISDMFGYSEDELYAMAPLEIVDETSKADVAEQIEGRTSGRIVRSRHRFRGVTASGAVRTFEVDGGRAIYQGQPAVIGTLRDVTEEALAQQRLLDAEQRYRAIVETASDAIITIDGDSTIRFVNPAAEEMFGYEPGTLAGQPLSVIIPERFRRPHVQAVERFRQSRTRTISWRSVEFPALHRDGTPIPLELSFAHFLENGEDRFVAIARDMRSRKALEWQLDHERRISGLGRLAATMAHEFNNVLMGVQTASEMLSKKADAANRDRALSMVRRSIARGRRVTADILMYASARQSTFVAIDLAQWLRDIADDIRSIFSSGTRIDIEIDHEPVWILADPPQLSQVMLNLASNARDAIDGAGTFRITLTDTATGSAFPSVVPDVRRFCQMVVEDSGAGIPPENLETIFDPFFTTKGNAGGTGLGLALVRKVIQQHQGFVSVESSVGCGTAFHLFFPRSGEPAPQPALEPRTSLDEKPARLLIVENDDVIADGLVAILETRGVTCDRLSEGEATLAAIERFDPDVVVLDVGLPDVSGLEVLRRIRQRRTTIPVILSTGVNVNDPLVNDDACVGILMKPYETDDLLDLCAALMKR